MLDLLISYINFLILSIKYIVKRILFHPPNPKGYKIIETINNHKKHIEIYVKRRNYKDYHKIKKKVQLDIEFHKIPDKKNNNIPIFIFKPSLSLHSACIIYCHGNSCDIGSTFTECCDLAKLTKCIVISFDYPGYGIYQNIEPNEKNIYQTVRIMYEYVRENLKFDESSIIVYGFSLGTGVAFDLACDENYKFAGLILQSPFLSIVRTTYNTKRTKYFDSFNNCDKAKLLKRKTLFIHGNQDQIVPYVHGRILSKLIPQNLFFGFQTIDGAGHNNLFSPKYIITLSDTIKDFIEKCCNSIKFKDNKTVKVKEMNKLNYNFETSQNNNNSSSKYINEYNNTCSSKFINKNIFNTSIHESIQKEKNENEIENKSFSENNSVFLSRKKESFLELLKHSKNDGRTLLKSNQRFITTEDEKNGFDSVEKFIKTEKISNKKYLNNSTTNNDKSQTNIIDKTEKNSIYYNNIKTVNISESSLTQKEDFSDNIVEFNILGKKTSKIPMQHIIDISKSE